MEQDTTQPRSHNSSGLWTGLWMWVMLFILVLYPLSIGPAAILHKNCSPMRPAIEWVYTPLTGAADHCRPIRQALEWYVSSLWGIIK